MTCAVCRKAAPDMAHAFFEGTKESPVRRWVIWAPLYFKADATNTRAIEGYCGPVCATKALTA